MKKLTALILCITILTGLLAGCAKASVENPMPSDDVEPDVTEIAAPTQVAAYTQNAESLVDAATPSEAEKRTHTEYVETITIYAEKGAVVTWYDETTGQFAYKYKCETCGTLSGEHTGQKMSTNGRSLDEGFTCTNSSCSMWGKSQRAIIKCSVSGEYVEVDD